MVSIKREKWGKNYKIVVRSDSGKILSHKKWDKNFTVPIARNIFNKNKSLDNNKKVTSLVNVKEISVNIPMRKGKVIRYPRLRSGFVQYELSAVIGGKVIVARSDKGSTNQSKKK